MLNAAAVRRGAFSNSGTKDIGLDKDWDFKANSYKYRTEEKIKLDNSKSRYDAILSPLGEKSAAISEYQSKQK